MEPEDDIVNDPANVRLAADLRRLAEAIDQAAYPGRAWPVRQRHAVLRIYWPPAAVAAAAAAVLLLAILISHWHGPTQIAPPAQVARLAKPQAVQNEGDWDVPADITPSLADLAQPNLAGQLDLEMPTVPSLSMPSLGGGSFTWTVPQMDLIPKIDLDRNVPAEDSQTHTPQTNGKDENA